MTKKLEQLFELASSEENDLTIPLPEVTEEITETALNTLDKIEAALPQVKGLEASDNEMDELAQMATDSYKDLMDLGMQVESRFSSEIFNSASSMLGHAITAKTAKINKKLKMIDLQMKKAQLDAKQSIKNEEVESTTLGEGRSLDRNELLKMLANKNNEE
jgi:CRISPR/Cas system CMR-associated protein Cmr5 small subunit